MAKQLKGDINNDGKIDFIDLMICFSVVSGYLTLDTNEASRADVDSDAQITAVDARKILQHIECVKLIDGVIE